LNIAAVSTSRD